LFKGNPKKSTEKKLVKEKINASITQIKNIEESSTTSNLMLKKANAEILRKIKEGGLNGISINQFLNKKEAKEDSENHISAEIGEDRKNFNQKQLNKLWSDYAEIINKKGKVSLSKLFLEKYPKIEQNFLLNFPLDSQALAEDLKSEKPALLSHLRKSLNNFSININFPVLTSEETKTLYTADDKFKHMSEKHKQLIYLKRLLELDLN
jgi:hypothetical protein